MMTLVEKAKELRMLIEEAVQSLDDEKALKGVCLYPKWNGDGVKYEAGMRMQYNGVLYKVKDGMAHTSQADWSPDVAVSLFEVVNETNKGTSEDPIPYSGNMALEKGKYYSQDGVTYLCTRDTGIAVYNTLAELVGIYVELA